MIFSPYNNSFSSDNKDDGILAGNYFFTSFEKTVLHYVVKQEKKNSFKYLFLNYRSQLGPSWS
jgi:hypothetical protein